jgi:hypothetical protein
MKLLLIGESESVLPQVDECYFIDVMESRCTHWLRLLAKVAAVGKNDSKAVSTEPWQIGRSFMLSGNLGELEQDLQSSGWSDVAEFLMEKGRVISAGLVDAQGSAVLVLSPAEVREFSGRLEKLLETNLSTTMPEYAAHLKALAAFLAECSHSGLCVLRFCC